MRSLPLSLQPKEITPCDLWEQCLNSKKYKIPPSCHTCRLSPDYAEGSSYPSHWLPWDGKMKHPVEQANHRRLHAERLKQLREKRKNKDRSRQAIAKAAEKAERQTERAIIKATINSGRKAQDGDHLYLGKIALDTKLQTSLTSHSSLIVHLDQLEKIRADAKRAGAMAGGLVLCNDQNRRVVVFALEDLPKLPL